MTDNLPDPQTLERIRGRLTHVQVNGSLALSLQNESAQVSAEVYTAALDRELNAQKYILPGLGDFGDRLFGT